MTSPFPPNNLTAEELISIDKLFAPLKDYGPAGVFIDGANVYHTSKALGFEIDFKNLKLLLEHYLTIRSINYFAADSDSKGAKALQNFLANNGYDVHVKSPVQKPYFEGDHPVVVTKKNIDTAMTAVAIDKVHNDTDLRQTILFTGDGDFVPAVDILKRRGPVTVISTNVTSPSLICKQLRRECKYFIDINDLKPAINWIKRSQ